MQASLSALKLVPFARARRPRHGVLLQAARTAVALATLATLAACAGSARPAPVMVRYDLGSAAANALVAAPAAVPASGSDAVPPAASSAPRNKAVRPAARPALKVLDVRAVPGLDTDQFRYRLLYADAAVAHVYASSRWAATPAQLFTQRLKQQLAAGVNVLDGGDPVRAPLLKVDLTEFAQFFDGPGQSRGVLAARATLLDADRVLAQRDFLVTRVAPSADAAGGARALAAASDDLIQQLAGWLPPLPSAAVPTSGMAPVPPVLVPPR